MLEVERRVLAADEAAREELVPALGAVGLLVGLGDDGRLLAVAQVAQPRRPSLSCLSEGNSISLKMAACMTVAPIHGPSYAPASGAPRRGVAEALGAATSGRP